MKQFIIIMMVLFTITAFADRKDVINELSASTGIPTPSYNNAMNGLTSQNCVIQYRQSNDNVRTLNRLILFHLVFADNQLMSSDVSVQKNAFAIAYEAANEAFNILKNDNLAFGITQSFLISNIKLAPQESWQYMSREDVLLFSAYTANKIKNMTALISAYRSLIAIATDDITADANRVRLIDALQVSGQYNDAIAVYNEIKEDTVKNNLSKIYADLLKKSK